MSMIPSDVPVVGLVRAARRRAGLSQRGLAKAARISPSTVNRIEAGALVPSVALLQRLLAVGDVRLVAVDQDCRQVVAMENRGDATDGAGRRYPSHLDTILDPWLGEWWGDLYGLARPPETFHRDRLDREARRARSRWEVRVAQCRRIPPPRIVPDGRRGLLI